MAECLALFPWFIYSAFFGSVNSRIFHAFAQMPPRGIHSNVTLPKMHLRSCWCRASLPQQAHGSKSNAATTCSTPHVVLTFTNKEASAQSWEVVEQFYERPFNGLIKSPSAQHAWLPVAPFVNPLLKVVLSSLEHWHLLPSELSVLRPNLLLVLKTFWLSFFSPN